MLECVHIPKAKIQCQKDSRNQFTGSILDTQGFPIKEFGDVKRQISSVRLKHTIAKCTDV
jgi:hypothetical protein